MRRVAAACASLVALAAGCADCGGGVRCNSDAECLNGTACVGGVCDDDGGGGEGEGEGEAIVISGVDGDGSARAPSSSPVPDGVNAAHRVATALVVTGAHLDVVTSATLGDVPLDIIANDGATMQLRLPSTLQAGLATLVLSSTTAAAAQAQVFVLQGEAGPPGGRGHDALVEPRAADTGVCPGGGVGIAFGVDENDDGVLQTNEENPSLARDLCAPPSSSLDGVIDCATGTCVSTLPFAAPALTASGRPVLTRLTTPTTVRVPAEAPNVGAALASFGGIELAAGVTVVVDGVIDEPAPITITRGDFASLTIEGGTPDAELRFTDDSGFVIASDGRLGSLTGITITGNDNAAAIGVVVADGAFASLGPDVVVQHFAHGVIAVRNADVLGDALVLRNNQTGLIVNASTAQVLSSIFEDDTTGIAADLGASVSVNNSTIRRNVVGIVAANSSVVLATGSLFDGNTGIAIEVANAGDVSADSASFTGNVVDVSAAAGSLVRVDGAAGIVNRNADASSVIFP